MKSARLKGGGFNLSYGNNKVPLSPESTAPADILSHLGNRDGDKD
jgi:hypothetical protein